MQIQAIGLSNINESTFSKQNNIQSFNNLKFDNDTVSFSGKKISEQDKCRQLLEKSGMNPYPRILVEKELNNFRTKLKKSEILKSLLAIGVDKGTKLKATDFINYFSVLSDTTITSQLAAIELLKVEKEELGAITSNEVDDAIFLPLENDDKLTSIIGKVYSRYSKLPQEKRASILSNTFEVLSEASRQDKDFSSLEKKIADKFNKMSDESGAYLVLVESVPYCNKKKFEKLLNVLDEKNCAMLCPLAESGQLTQKIIDKVIQ